MPSSSAKCSAAKVGPNLSSSAPEYFSLNKIHPPTSKFLRLAAIRGPAGIPMLEPFAAPLPIPPPQSLRLAIAELEEHRRLSELQVPTPHSPHDFHSL